MGPFEAFAKDRATDRMRCKVCALDRALVLEIEAGLDNDLGAPAAVAYLASLGHSIGTATLYKHQLYHRKEEK